MTSIFDRFMVSLGFNMAEIRQAKYRRVLYAGIILMSGLALLGLALNLGL